MNDLIPEIFGFVSNKTLKTRVWRSCPKLQMFAKAELNKRGIGVIMRSHMIDPPLNSHVFWTTTVPESSMIKNAVLVITKQGNHFLKLHKLWPNLETITITTTLSNICSLRVWFGTKVVSVHLRVTTKKLTIVGGCISQMRLDGTRHAVKIARRYAHSLEFLEICSFQTLFGTCSHISWPSQLQMPKLQKLHLGYCTIRTPASPASASALASSASASVLPRLFPGLASLTFPVQWWPLEQLGRFLSHAPQITQLCTLPSFGVKALPLQNTGFENITDLCVNTCFMEQWSYNGQLQCFWPYGICPEKITRFSAILSTSRIVLAKEIIGIEQLVQQLFIGKTFFEHLEIVLPNHMPFDCSLLTQRPGSIGSLVLGPCRWSDCLEDLVCRVQKKVELTLFLDDVIEHCQTLRKLCTSLSIVYCNKKWRTKILGNTKPKVLFDFFSGKQHRMEDVQRALRIIFH